MLVDADPSGSSSRRTSATAAGSASGSIAGVDWNELAGIVEDAYAEIAPAKLVEAARSRQPTA